jgi:HD-GYP domain-containing protein (c-di-GMP phosphodiesterase class II)
MSFSMKVFPWELIECVSRTMDMLNSKLPDHHSKTAYIATNIATTLNMNIYAMEQLAYAALLHDCGVFSLAEGNMLADFKFEEEDNDHAEKGAKLLKGLFGPDLPEIVRFHHHKWNYGEGKEHLGMPVPIESHIIHLADRVAVLVPPGISMFSERRSIIDTITAKAGSHFHPDIVAAFAGLAEKDSFWLEIGNNNLNQAIWEMIPISSSTLDLDKLHAFSQLLSHLIDYKSRFTASHSAGIALVARILGFKCGLSDLMCSLIEIAAFLHELGQLAVPSEILEKPGGLEAHELELIRLHSHMTYSALKNIRGMEDIAQWASEHHEKLDGTGYPYNKNSDALSLGSRILAVADVYTALSEDRPYRKGMQKDSVISMLEKMSGHHLDSTIVSILISSFDEINDLRLECQENAYRTYVSSGFEF